MPHPTRRQVLAAAPALLRGAAPRQKNVLLIMCDEHKPHALGIDEDPLARTPNLDALARQSVRFDHAYCTSPVCVPSRFSLMTGLYPHKGRVYGNNNPWPSSVKTLAQYFDAAGYATANIGKMHAVDNSPHGFEHFLEIKDWFNYLGPKRKIWDDEMDRNGKDGRKGPVHVGRVSLLPEENHFESWVARESIRYLTERKHDRPFFLVSSFIKPHDPFMPAERFAKLFPSEKVKLPDTWGKLDVSTVPRRVRTAVLESPHTPELLNPDQARIRIAMYYANLMQSDERIGTVLDTLRSLGLDDDTIILYTSDHGDMVGDKGMWLKFQMYENSVGVPLMFRVPGLDDDTIILYTSDHGDMVGDKGMWLKFQMYENSVGVPLMFRVPGMTRGGSRTASPASLVQVVPTLAELCGFDVPAKLDGPSLVPCLKHPEERLDSIAYSEFGLPTGMQMLRRGDHKYIYNRNDMEQLYDLRRDPKEMTNLALDPAHQETAATLRREMAAILDPAAKLPPGTTKAQN